MPKFYVSKSDSRGATDLNRRYIKVSGTNEIVCVFNFFFDHWTGEDERRLQLILAALNAAEKQAEAVA